jgi:hypothetical protein
MARPLFIEECGWPLIDTHLSAGHTATIWRRLLCAIVQDLATDKEANGSESSLSGLWFPKSWSSNKSTFTCVVNIEVRLVHERAT